MSLIKLHRHAHTALAATLARMQQHIVPHMQLHNLPYSALLVVSATQARMQVHNLPCEHAHTALSATQARMHWHNRPHRHRIVCQTHPHARSGIIRHTGLHAVACGHICRYTSYICHTGMHAGAKSATQACTHSISCISCDTGMHAAAYTAMRLHNLPYSAILVASATQARMQLHNLPHRHTCRCIICRAGMHALHYLSHRHACSGIVDHTGTALSATHTLKHAVA